MKYKRILLKVSGEALMGEKDFGIDPRVLQRYAEEIAELQQSGVEIGIVIGGGNIYRGVENSSDGVDRVTGDLMGTLATIRNGLALQSGLAGAGGRSPSLVSTIERRGTFTRLLSSIKMEEIAEPFIRRRAIRHLEKGRVVIFGAGTGNAYFTTDTAAALRAVEIGADVIMKGTRVDGIYTSDPEKNPKANRFGAISYQDVLKKDLKVMDLTAITLCKENSMPIVVFNMNVPGSLKRIVGGEKLGTIVSSARTVQAGKRKRRQNT